MKLIEADIGDSIKVRGHLTDEAGADISDGDVSARSMDPDGNEVLLGEAINEGDGVYSIIIEPDQAGEWLVRFESASPNKAAAEGKVFIRPSRFS